MRLFVTKQKEKEIIADAVNNAIENFVIGIIGEEEYYKRLNILLEQHPNMSDELWYDRTIIRQMIGDSINLKEE